MANLYGVANPILYPTYQNVIGGADIPCPAGSETDILLWPSVTAISQGVYYPLVFPQIFFTCGAVIPTSVAFGMRINDGADVAQIGYGTNALVASATLCFTAPLRWSVSGTLYQPPGVNLQVSCIATGQAVTVRLAGTWALMMLMRAPDQ